MTHSSLRFQILTQEDIDNDVHEFWEMSIFRKTRDRLLASWKADPLTDGVPRYFVHEPRDGVWVYALGEDSAFRLAHRYLEDFHPEELA